MTARSEFSAGYAYDDVGRLAEVRAGGEVAVYRYDPRGDLVGAGGVAAAVVPTAPLAFCTSCGAKLETGAAFCNACGAGTG